MAFASFLSKLRGFFGLTLGPEVIAASAFGALSLGGFLAGVYAGWPGAPAPCAERACWCEAARPGAIREWWNTLSNLPLFALSLFVAHRAAGARRAGRWRAQAILGVFVYALWLEGTGALFYHASFVDWAAVLDGTSVLAIWGTIFSSSLFRLFRFGPIGLMGAVLAFLLGALLYRLGLGQPIEVPGFIFMVTTLSLEPVLLARQAAPRTLRALTVGLVAFVASAVVWTIADAENALCQAGVPLHAFWHVLAGIAVTGFGLHAAENGQRDFDARAASAEGH